MKQYLEKEGELLSSANNDGYEHYLKVRSRFNAGEYSPYDFIFLSRAGFNGMMRFNSKGNWNIPFCKKPDRFAQAYITKITNQVATVSKIIQEEPDWIFQNKSFAELIPIATEKDEELLFNLLLKTKAKFILSTWHHNDWRQNEMIEKFWSKFNVVTKDHFYHNGGSIENRRTVVEALVCNFDIGAFAEHNHGLKEKKKNEQLEIQWA